MFGRRRLCRWTAIALSWHPLRQTPECGSNPETFSCTYGWSAWCACFARLFPVIVSDWLLVGVPLSLPACLVLGISHTMWRCIGRASLVPQTSLKPNTLTEAMCNMVGAARRSLPRGGAPPHPGAAAARRCCRRELLPPQPGGRSSGATSCRWAVVVMLLRASASSFLSAHAGGGGEEAGVAPSAGCRRRAVRAALAARLDAGGGQRHPWHVATVAARGAAEGSWTVARGPRRGRARGGGLIVVRLPGEGEGEGRAWGGGGGVVGALGVVGKVAVGGGTRNGGSMRDKWADADGGRRPPPHVTPWRRWDTPPALSSARPPPGGGRFSSCVFWSSTSCAAATFLQRSPDRTSRGG